jgi:hypothetical protein
MILQSIYVGYIVPPTYVGYIARIKKGDKVIALLDTFFPSKQEGNNSRGLSYCRW